MRSRYEIKATKELKADGWTVDYKIKPSRFYRGQQIDFFGRFDLVAVKRGQPIRWISIKGHAGYSKRHLQSIKDFWMPECCQKEIWVWPKNKKKKDWIKKVY